MKAWHRDAARYALLYAGGAVLLVTAVGYVPGVPTQPPVFALAILGGALAWLPLQRGEGPELDDLPEKRTEKLPRRWRMLLFGVGVFVFSWVVLGAWLLAPGLA